MKFPPMYSSTPAIKKLLYDLDVLRAGFELHPVSHNEIINLRRSSLLKSSLFSAKIEGNPLELSDVSESTQDVGNVHRMEVVNLVSAYERLTKEIEKNVTVGSLKRFHAIVLKGISRDAGQLRSEESAIYNHAGIAVYLTPAPHNIQNLTTALCTYINSEKDHQAVKAGVAHIWFEKIHPFLDGNGRVGRLLSAYILNKGGYSFSGLVPLEQYLEKHRDDYYYFLGRDKQDVTEFIEFYLTSLLFQARETFKNLHEHTADTYAHLLPRRAEIMRIIKDHRDVTFDFLSRRFRKVPPRTLHYDLAQLMKAGLVQKMGATRGASYTLVRSRVG